MNPVSTAASSRTTETMASVYALSDQHVAANPKAAPLPHVNSHTFAAVRLLGYLIEEAPPPEPLRENGRGYQRKEGQPITPEPVRRKERERQRQSRLKRIAAKPLRGSRIANDGGAIHKEITSMFRKLEQT
jgi:hypothetical protein